MKDFNLDIPKMGYFICYESNNSWISKQIIREQRQEGFNAEDSQIVHVEISFGGPYSIGAVFPKSKLLNIKKEYPGRRIKLVKYKGYDEVDYTARYKVAAFGATRCNLKYGWFSLLWFIIKDYYKKLSPFGSIDTPFCSLLCAWALTRVFHRAFDSYRTVMPADFLDKDKFEIVWEGSIE